MAPGPELFVVCKSCGSEVSPYITECPYCGARLRKRAPKIERDRPPAPARRSARLTLGPLRPGEIPGISADPLRRPYVTLTLLALSLSGLLIAIVVTPIDTYALIGQPTGTDWWKLVTSPFIYLNHWYEFAVLLTIAIYGWRIERRDSPLAVLALFVVCGMGGLAVGALLSPNDLAIGGNGAALGLLACWVVPELVREHRGLERESDLLGTVVIAVVVLAMPLATDSANTIAGGFGLVVGALAGLLSARRVARL